MSAGTRFDPVCRAIFRAVAALALAGGIALPAQGGGPLALFNQQPVVYPNGGTALTLNLDQGPLGARSNAQATVIVQHANAMWNGVGTSTLRLALGPPLGADYTLANYMSIMQNYSDGLNPVIFDTDGSIIDAVFGVGAKSNVLGFAGSGYSGTHFLEGRAVLNGFINISDATLTVVLAHEIGHFFGLDHAQLDSTQGLASNNYVLMYPIAYRTLQTLHEDDIAAVTALYPAANAGSTYGQLTGTLTTAGGTAILGANIWARETSTGKVYSVVSDFLTQGNGYFRLHLPAGTYTLNAESIASNFIGGSRVGPYSATAGSASFLAPHPIAAVALGGASAQQIAIVAGCLATAAFRLDGSGYVTGNCGPPVPAVTTTTLASSVNPATVGESVTLTATVVGAAPTGAINFQDGGVTIAGCGAVALGGSGNSRTAQCGSSTLAQGAHSVTAAYGGDANNAGSTSGALSQAVNTSSTTWILSVTRNGTGSGTVTGNRGGLNCGLDCAKPYASTPSVALTAAPAPGSVFMGWLGACSGAGLCNLNVSVATSVSATFAPNTVLPRADIDGNSSYDALTDGLLMIRYLFGLTGNPLTSGAIGAGATRSTPAEIGVHLGNLRPLLDVDGNGQADALTDGLMLIRYLFGLRGNALIADAIGTGATRITAAQIEPYIQSLLP